MFKKLITSLFKPPQPVIIQRRWHPNGRPGSMEVSTYYADNTPFAVDVILSFAASDWYEFEGTDLYRELKGYMDNLKTQKESISRNNMEVRGEKNG